MAFFILGISLHLLLIKTKQMKRILLALLIGLTIVSCNKEPEGFVINGEFTGEVADGTLVFLKKIEANNQPIAVDTATVTGGKFQFTGAQDLPELHYLFLDKSRENSAIVIENGEIDFKAQKDSLRFAKIGGTVQNERKHCKKNLLSYRKSTRILS